MATLVEVLAEFFRSFGYAPTPQYELEGVSGRRHAVPLLLEKDLRRLPLTAWLHREPLGPRFLQEFLDAVQDAGCDGGVVLSLGPVPEPLRVQAHRQRVQVWDSLRVAHELGSAVLRETLPDVWHQPDPWSPPRPSRILDQIHAASLQAAPSPETPPRAPAPGLAPAAPAAAPDPALEPPLEASSPPTLAAPHEAAPETLELPFAFGVLDQATEPAPAPPTAVPAAPALAPAPAPVLASMAPSWTPRPGPRVLRLQVSRDLAVSLAKPQTRTVDRLFLRLVPHHVFDYEAALLVEGNPGAEHQRGRMAVDAATKRVVPWGHNLDVADFSAEGTDVDEKPVRIQEPDAHRLLAQELRRLVTRDVVLEEDGSEWSVVIKKKVELAENELRLSPLGLYWLPIWRVTGRDGSVEIEATTGQILREEITAPQPDALLL